MTVFRVLASFFACIGFAVVLNVPKKELISCGFVGLVSFAVYTALSCVMGADSVVPMFFGMVAATIVARGMSYRRKAPSTIYVITGMLPLVPGAGMYYTMYGILNSDIVFSYMKGAETLKAAGVIAMGIILVFLFPPEFFKIGMKRKEN